jgi:SAM-dependent methyltransferase
MSLENRKKPLAQDEYEILAASYAARVDTKPHNAFYDRPAVLSLLPDVRGRDVLDAGCGPGAYTQVLAERGARIVALDASPAMLELAQERIRERVGASAPVEWMQANLEEPLGLPSDRFDLVTAPLVLDYIEDWEPTLREFCRVLRPGGALVFSCGHPAADDKYLRGSYFDRELMRIRWRGFGEVQVEMPSFHRPLGEMINAVLRAGFVLDFVLEPLPTEDFHRADPEGAAELEQRPGFIAMGARSS